jgi:hypothetical protein
LITVGSFLLLETGINPAYIFLTGMKERERNMKEVIAFHHLAIIPRPYKQTVLCFNVFGLVMYFIRIYWAVGNVTAVTLKEFFQHMWAWRRWLLHISK